MNRLKEDNSGNICNSEAFRSSANEAIERLLGAADSRFQCSEIVGRRFADVGDHAGYLCSGGCSGITETLAGR